MMERGNDSTWIDLQIAGLRWLVYLGTGAVYLLLWLIDQQSPVLARISPAAFTLAGAALIYNVAITLLAYAGLFGQILPAVTVLLDTALVMGWYYYTGPATTPSELVFDPLLLLLLFPVITVAVRFHWMAGLLVGILAGVARAMLLLWGYPEPISPAVVMPGLLGALVIIGVAFLTGYIAEMALGQGLRFELRSARRQVQEMRSSVERADRLQQITSTLGSTLNFERVLERSLDVAERAMADWGAKGQLLGMVLLFNNGQGLRLAAGRRLARHDFKRTIEGKKGIVARCLDEVDVVTTLAPRDDPELTAYTGVGDCKVAAAIPLRAGFENYGAIVFATAAFKSFSQEQLDLFSGIADRATLALHNASLYQSLQAEKDRILQVEEEARHRLSRDLHDGPTQSISAVAMRINFARKMIEKDPQKLRHELEVIEELARQTVTEIRTMLFTLRPLALETQGLVPALQMLVEKLQERGDTQIKIHDVGNATERMDANQSAVIFYIIEEALGNACKHAKASVIDVRMWVESKLFVAQIRDDGVGFDAEAVQSTYESRTSLGMVNMRERAELVDGSLDIRSVDGQGTTVTLVVPLRERVESPA
jgi:signal transduction histidine kinase